MWSSPPMIHSEGRGIAGQGTVGSEKMRGGSGRPGRQMQGKRQERREGLMTVRRGEGAGGICGAGGAAFLGAESVAALTQSRNCPLSDPLELKPSQESVSSRSLGPFSFQPVHVGSGHMCKLTYTHMLSHTHTLVHSHSKSGIIEMLGHTSASSQSPV